MLLHLTLQLVAAITDLIFLITDGQLTTQIEKAKNVFHEFNTAARAAGTQTDELKDKITALAGGNAKLEKYFNSLGTAGEASLKGYIGYLIRAEGKTLALKAATLALNAALQFGISMLVSLAINGVAKAVQAVEDARKAAVESAKEFQETSTSLHDLVEQYKSLYSETGGTWDTTTLVSVHNIQQQITDLVGDQAEGIELVNGALDEQLALLRNIDAQQAQTWQETNQDAVRRAQKYLDRQRNSKFVYPGSKEGRDWLAQNREKYGFTSTNQNNKLVGTVEELIAVYTQMYKDLDTYARDNDLQGQVSGLLATFSEKLRELKSDEYNEYKDILAQWYKSEAIIQQSNGQYSNVLQTGFADQAAFDEYISGLRSATDGNKELRDAMIEVVKNAFPEFVQATSSAAEGAEKQASGIDYLIEKYKKLRAANEELSKYGSVDLTNRPQVQMDDGSVATVLSSNGEYTARRSDKETRQSYNQDVIIHYTPILPDGEVLSDEAVQRYLQAAVDNTTVDQLIGLDTKYNGIILKIDTDFDFTLSDEQKDKLWDAIGDAYDELSGVYAQSGLEGLTAKITDAMTSAGVPIEDAAKYLAALFDADQWDIDLHTAQEALYSMQYAAYGTGTSFEDLISTSEMLQRVLAGMTIPEALEFLSNGNMGSAKNFTSYFDAVDEISKLQKQLTDAQKEMLDGGTISSGTATDVYTALVAAGENYLDYLTIEGDQIKLNTEAYKKFIQQQVYEKNGVADLSRALAEELALQEELKDAERNAYLTGGLDEAVRVRKQLRDLEAEYGTVEELQNAIKQLEAIFNAAWDENGLKSGTEGLGAALEATETKAAELENAIRSLKQAGNLDELTQTDFSNLLTQFPKLKRWLDAYSKGQITATRLLGIFQNALDQFNAGGVFDDLATAKDSISALGKVVNDLNDNEGVSFSTLSSIQEAFSGVDGIEDYIQYLKEAKTNTEEVSNIIGTLLYQSLIEAAGSTQDLANADEALIASLLKEAGVADATAAAHQAVERAKQDSAIASKVAAAATTDDITAIYNECIALGMTKDAIYQVVATQIIFSNTKMDVSQKIAALNLLSQTCGVAIGAVSGVSDAVAGLGGVSAEGVSGLAAHYLKTNRAATKQQAEQMALNAIYSNKMKASNPFNGVDFSSLGSSSSGGGGGTAKTKAEEIKSAFDDLNTTMEHSIYLEQQYYNVADSEYDYDGMKQALQNQVGYYKQIQAAAESAMEQVRAYYRSKGMSDAVIEQQSEIQALQKAWWEAANSIDESLDKIATAIRDKLSKEVDDIQNAWSSLQKAAEEYSSTGVISIDSLQAIISAGVEYVSLLKDENGQLVLNEDAVSAVLEAKTQQLAVESALSYVEQVRNALMQNNVTELNRLLDVTSVTASSTWDLVYAQAALLNLNGNQYNQLINNINKFRSIATTTVKTIRKQVRNSVQNETKDYKSALDDVLKLVEDLIKYEHEQMVDALEDQRDAYQALIDKKKELLQQTKDEEDYESNVSKKLKEISRIQDQINRLSLDDSREAAAKRAQLEEELAGLQEDLASYVGDYVSGKNEETLDKAAEDYSQYIDERIKKVEDEISSEEKLYRAAIERINSDWGGLYQDILDWNYKAGSSIESEIIEKWALASEAVQRYGSFVAAAQATAAGNSLGDSFSYDYDQSAGDPAATAAANSIVERMKANAAAWHGASKSEQARLSAENEQLAQQLAQYVGAMPTKDRSGVWWLNGQKLFDIYPKYHQGGVVGGLQNEKQKELLTVLKDGELVSTEQMQERTIELIDFADNIAKRLKSLPYMNGFGSLLKNDALTALPKLTPAQGGSQSMVFSPSIQVTIQHNGSVSDSDAEVYGNKIADITLGKLSEAFGKKGIRNFSGTLLKA